MCTVINQAKLCFFFKLWALMYCLQTNSFFSDRVLGEALPIDTNFSLPAPLPTWPPGGGFATGRIDLGGLEVRKVTTFQRVWRGERGGVNDQGASFFDPYPMPEGFSMLGSYGQPNAKKLFGWVLVGRTNARDGSGEILKRPMDYSLVYKTSGDSPGYFWLPIPTNGYKAVGYVVTTSPNKPPFDKIRCVRSDFTDEPETESWIWGPGDGSNVYALRPKTRGANAQPASVGTFYINPNGDDSNITISCLKSKSTNSSSVPNLSQVQALFRTYSPCIYLHPGEHFLPASVNWFFSNGALLYKKGEEGKPVAIQPNGTNLPQGGDNDGLYWIDLPQDRNAQDKVKRGDLQSAETYLHVKSVLGGTFTDIQLWLFYPFNGPGTAKIAFVERISLGNTGEHVGDWEHVTLRISNFDGILYKVYFGQHNKGQWVDSSLIEFQKDNKFVGYSSLNGHASYHLRGLVLLGGEEDVGIRDDTDKSNNLWDTGARFSVVAGDGLSAVEAVVEPPWLNYKRKWGPDRSSDVGKDLEKVRKHLLGKLKSLFDKLIRQLPPEVLAESGPVGPKKKSNWIGDEESE